MEAISKLIRTRRSVFPSMYSGDKVDDTIIEEMLENANWAPTHKLTQPWRFVVFTGEGLERLGQDQAEIYKTVSSANGDFMEKKYEDLKIKPTKASHVIAIIMKRDEKERIPAWEEISSVASAVQNMSLTAAAHGVGSYWGSGGITNMAEAKTYFELEDKDQLLGFLFVGMPERVPEGRRDPIESKVRWVRY